MTSEPPLKITLTVQVEGAEKDQIQVVASYSDETFDEKVLDKVRELMMQAGVTETRARKIISHCNDNGIVFRQIL